MEMVDDTTIIFVFLIEKSLYDLSLPKMFVSLILETAGLISNDEFELSIFTC